MEKSVITKGFAERADMIAAEFKNRLLECEGKRGYPNALTEYIKYDSEDVLDKIDALCKSGKHNDIVAGFLKTDGVVKTCGRFYGYDKIEEWFNKQDRKAQGDVLEADGAFWLLHCITRDDEDKSERLIGVYEGKTPEGKEEVLCAEGGLDTICVLYGEEEAKRMCNAVQSKENRERIVMDENGDFITDNVVILERLGLNANTWVNSAPGKSGTSDDMKRQP